MLLREGFENFDMITLMVTNLLYVLNFEEQILSIITHQYVN